VERRIWIGLLAGLLPVLALVAFVGMLRHDSAVTADADGPARSSNAKPAADKDAPPARATVEPPAPAPIEPAPQAHLMQPELPPPPAPEPPPRMITVARWPLGAPATHEPPPALANGRWSRPLPLEPSAADTEVALASGPAQATPLKPVPSPVAVTFPKRAKDPGSRPLTGEYPCPLAGRELTLPQEVRQQLGASNRRQLYVTPAPDGCLWLHTAAGLDRLADRLDHASGGAARVRKAARVCFSQTEACGLDRSGRFALPERLAQYAGLQRDAVLLGVGDHLELWDAQRWQQYSQTQDKGMR
jgi:MraZ protein